MILNSDKGVEKCRNHVVGQRESSYSFPEESSEDVRNFAEAFGNRIGCFGFTVNFKGGAKVMKRVQGRLRV
jgi:hypothetical protein